MEVAAFPIVLASQVPILGAAGTSGNQALILAAVIGAGGSIVAAVLLTRRSSKQQLQSIEVKVDGRLEAALQQIDASARIIAALTGGVVPPDVAGLNKPVTPGEATPTKTVEEPKSIHQP